MTDYRSARIIVESGHGKAKARPAPPAPSATPPARSCRVTNSTHTSGLACHPGEAASSSSHDEGGIDASAVPAHSLSTMPAAFNTTRRVAELYAAFARVNELVARFRAAVTFCLFPGLPLRWPRGSAPWTMSLRASPATESNSSQGRPDIVRARIDRNLPTAKRWFLKTAVIKSEWP